MPRSRAASGSRTATPAGSRPGFGSRARAVGARAAVGSRARAIGARVAVGSRVRAVADRLRRPEYTGANRCAACTAVNAVLGVALAAGLGGVGFLVAGPAAAVAVAVATLALAAASIGLRGYLVPGTPELTKRYFPPWLLRAFGKAPPTVGDGRGAETVLRSLGALADGDDRPSVGGTDDATRVSPAFAAAWHEVVAERPATATDGGVTDVPAVASLAAHLSGPEGGASGADVPTVGTDADGWIEATLADGTTWKWESGRALDADVASAVVLDHESAWRGLGLADQLHALRRLRAYLDGCPCGGRLEIETGQALLCCSDELRPMLACTDCGSDLHEFDAPR